MWPDHVCGYDTSRAYGGARGGMSKTRRTAGAGRKRRPREGPPPLRGWISTDEDEIKRRQWRGRTEIDQVVPLDADHHPFGDYRVTSSSGRSYLVEIRSLSERVNSCECHDYRVNRLGSCKHVEGVVHRLRSDRSRRARARDASDRIEVFIDERAGSTARAVRMTTPAELAGARPTLVREAARLYANLRRGSGRALRALEELARSHADSLRVSHRLAGWVAARSAARRRRREYDRFKASLNGAGVRELLTQPLLPYQVDGVLHLAFRERALLADDMGLGKTVQAIAACALLRKLRGIERVLVVAPASLKAEWEEQIARFSELPACLVAGNRLVRRAAYRKRTFFTLCNYEQILGDGDDLLDLLQPEVVILDEAQRIKNWQTKTANAVKRLRSRYAFVLTGTPLENRIDEIYSIVQFLDPELLGPLFRFNREFYELDAKGRPAGYRNLEQLADRIAPVMLRRRKEEVESQLPGRMTKTFFVPMTDTQRDVYDDYEVSARRLAARAQQRPLTKEEYEQLQILLACMRMVCDTPAILDGERHECPKLDEIERLLPELLTDPQRKILIFSEWVRMLELVRECAVAAGVEFAWHTGSVPQLRRRAEIHRFREDPDCRLFLSSESGGVGLNLQAADTVINLDQPWNPARLEQRIARAWRKHQTRPVTVINLVSEKTIEHRMLGLLDAKRALAEGVIDRRGDLSAIRVPTSRAAFMERLNAVLDAAESGDGDETPARADAAKSVADRLRDDLVTHHGAALQRILVREDEAEAGPAMLVVLAVPPARATEEEGRLAQATGMRVNVIDAATHEAMLRLAENGLITLPTAQMREVHPAPGAEQERAAACAARARTLVDQAAHKLKAAALLEGGGFAEEAQAPAVEAARLAVGALAAARGEPEPEDVEAATAFLLRDGPEGIPGGLPHEALRILSGEPAADGLVTAVRELAEHISGIVADLPGRVRTVPERPALVTGSAQ